MILGSRRVKAIDFNDPWFLQRMEELNEPFRLHRKLWEFCSIAQIYHDELYTGGSVLGFGVGREPLPAWFADQGAEVVATDRPEAGVWDAAQHARGEDELNWKGICSEEVFRGYVRYEPVDMRALPEHLTRGQFSMTYSASCFEHLGGIDAGLDFFCKQMACLRPGGLAVHTTEFNTGSETVTLNNPDLCVFRKRDFEELAARLDKQGDELYPIDFRPGILKADDFVDEAPYQQEPHLSLRLAGVTFTSVILIARKG